MTARWFIGLLLCIAGAALMRGYRLHGLLSGGDWRPGFWIGAALGVLGLGLIVDLFRDGRQRRG